MYRALGASAFLGMALVVPLEEAGAQDPVGGAIVGGATGAIIGGVLGGGRGAAIGAIIGGATGAAIGAEGEPRPGGYRYYQDACYQQQPDGAWLVISPDYCAIAPAYAQDSIGIAVDIGPPGLPVYDQPPIPASGYIWTPGYWAWDDDTGYYWVPGTWVLPPEPGLLWTPGYWGWNEGVYAFHEGYWGPEVGFYGGVSYGFGYTGVGYEGGYWRGGAFFYNRSVNNISNVSITNVYNKTVVVNNATNVSYNGGVGGTTAQATAQQLAAANERHVSPTVEQKHHVQVAAKDPSLSLNKNQGHPTVAATAHPAQFNGSGVIAAHPGQPVAAVTPQGHTISSPTKAATMSRGAPTISGGKGGPALTTPGTKAGPGTAAITPGNLPTTPGTRVPPGTPGMTPDVHDHQKATGGTPPSAGPTMHLPATTAHPPTPQVVPPTPPHAVMPPPPHAAVALPPPPHAVMPPPPHAAVALPPPPHAVMPPPPPHAAAPPPPRVAAPAPPRPPAPATKPKCQPGQQHC